MRNYPDEIHAKRLELIVLNEQIRDLREDQKKIETQETIEVLYAKGDNDKPRYTNDTQRSLALDQALGANGTYQVQKIDLQNLERKREELNAEIERLRDLFKVEKIERWEVISEKTGKRRI